MFSEYSDLIEKLKSEGIHPRFLTLYERHSELDRKIDSMSGQDAGTTHNEIDALKREKLRIKDEIHALLREEAAAR